MTTVMVSFTCGMILGVVIALNANWKAQSKQPSAAEPASPADMERLSKEYLNLSRIYIDALRWSVHARAFLDQIAPDAPGDVCSECGVSSFNGERHKTGCKVGYANYLRRVYDAWCDKQPRFTL